MGNITCGYIRYGSIKGKRRVKFNKTKRMAKWRHPVGASFFAKIRKNGGVGQIQLISDH